jgi:hypothetical protein
MTHVAFVFALGKANLQRSEPLLKARTLTFEANTYLPVTPTIWDPHESKDVTLAMQSRRDRLYQLLAQRKPGFFDEKCVRFAALTASRKIILLDKFGGVRTEEGEGRLTPKAFAEITKMVPDLWKVRIRKPAQTYFWFPNAPS